jgi:hypothetical protein
MDVENIKNHDWRRFINVDDALKTKGNIALSSQYKKIFAGLTAEMKKYNKTLEHNDIKKIESMINSLVKYEMVLNDILLAENIYIHALSVHGDKLGHKSSITYTDLEKIAIEKNKIYGNRNKKVESLQKVFEKIVRILIEPRF